MSAPPATAPLIAARLGLIRCHACGLPARAAPGHNRCARCGVALAVRKQQTLQRTWAFLIAALAMYIPANTLPIMQTTDLARDSAYTILGGVELLWTDGSWDLAVVVFVASVVVPLGKVLALAFLAISVQRKSSWRPGERTRLFHLVEIVGRWAMLDIFVVLLLVGLVQFNALVRIEPGSGVLAFAAVVVLTILATMSFDPRAIWDHCDG